MFVAGAPRRLLGVLYAEDFDDPPAAAAAPPEPEVIAADPGPAALPGEAVAAPGYSAEEIDTARQLAYADGLRAGLEQAREERAHATRLALAAIARQAEAARAEAAAEAGLVAEQLARTVLGVVVAALPTLSARHGEAELRALVRALLPGLAREPRILVRINPEQAAAVTAEIAALAPDLAARVRLVPSDNLPSGDLHVAWENGEAVREAGAVVAAVRDALAPLGLLDSGDAADARHIRELEHVG